jgi:hypothetical protein
MVYPDGDNHLQGDGIEDFLDMSGSKSIMTGFPEIRLGPKNFTRKGTHYSCPSLQPGRCESMLPGWERQRELIHT